MNSIEQRIVSTLIDNALSQGYTISVIDSYDAEGDCTVRRSTNPAEILAALDTTGGDVLIMRDGEGRKIGSVVLIYNGDDTVIADHTANEAMEALTAFAI